MRSDAAALALVVSAIALAPAASADGYYLRIGIGGDALGETAFTDVDCTSAAPAALYGCGAGPDGAERRSFGDFGASAHWQLGVGYAMPSLRVEFALAHRPGAAFAGQANFLDAGRRQDVATEVRSLTGLFIIQAEVAALRIGRVTPFIGMGVGVARHQVGETRMTFPRTTTVVPGGRRTAPAWALVAGAATPIAERLSLDVAWTYADADAMETGRGEGRVIWRDGSREPLVLDLATTRAEWAGHGLQISLRRAF